VPGSGPHWVRANLDFTLHRIEATATDLDAVEKMSIIPYAQRVGAKAMRARVAYFRGQYADALKGLAALKPADWSTGEYSARAEILAHTGHVDEARAELDRGIKDKKASAGFLHFAYGLLELDAGRYAEAQKHYEAALNDAPNYWVYEEHLAEILAKQGKLDDAGHRYLALIQKTENPEFMDALADIYAKKHEAEKERELRTRAHALFEQRVRLFPEASAGHALAHYFVHDTEKSVTLAETNRTTRPYGESWVLLAKSYMLVGRQADAQKTIEAVLATTWDTAETHKVASEVFAKSNQALATSERAKALKRNPLIFTE
jgi:tetratricopeptide (TPR) repeat protein